MKQYFILILSFLNGPIMSQSSDFEVLNGFDAIQSVLKSNGIASVLENSEQLDYNLAFVIKLPNGKILVSQSDGLIGVLFTDANSYQIALKARKFPVPDPTSPFFQERNLVVNLPQNIDYYSDQLRELTGHSISEMNDETLRSLSQKINADPEIKRNERIMIALGIYFGEVIRREIGGQWKMDRQATLNPYYIPYVALDKRNVVYWQSFFDHVNKRTVSLHKLKSKIKEYFRTQ